MQNNVLEYLENAHQLHPEQIAYIDEKDTISVHQIYVRARQLASLLCLHVEKKSPVLILSEKSVMTPVLYLAVLYAGCYYIPLGADVPEYRLKIILEKVNAPVLLTSGISSEMVGELGFSGKTIDADTCDLLPENGAELSARRYASLDIDPAYVIFTSGSSGTPKGIVTSHRAVIDCIDIYAKAFDIHADDIIGNQAPLDYISAVRDILLPLCTGAKTLFIPKRLFSLQKQLFEFVNAHKVTVLNWAAAALDLCCELNVFQKINLQTVRKVIFAGSVLPCKHLRVWQENLPDAVFINHYGPTEVTRSCTYYVVPGKVTDADVLPIGIPFENTEILLLNDQNLPVPPGDIGEICVRGAGLALGYYRDQERTEEAFIQNPLHHIFADRIYKTGDLGRLIPDGNYAFHGRMDSQIKHMGHRIELGEVELIAHAFPKIRECCCLYQQAKKQIWLFYVADCDDRELAQYLRSRLPAHMVPRRFLKLEALPRIFNGKLDALALKELM